MMNLPVSYLGVLLAAVASMVVGFIYYSPFVVGKPWMKLMGMKDGDMRPKGAAMGKIYGTSFVLALVTAYVLVWIIVPGQAYFHSSRLTAGLLAAFWVWVGFVMPVQATDYLFAKKPLQLVAINTGYQLISLLAMGAVLSYF